MLERFQDRYGLRIIQGWGMTEMSPVGGIALPPAGVSEGTVEDLDWRMRSGRVMGGVEMRVVGRDGLELPWDGVSEGEIEVRGPWVTGSYHNDPAPEKFRDGWLRTGDVGTIDERGFFVITDRIKDVIKSGGEWISSVELENQLMAHPAVQEAAVIGMPDARWGERPLASVVLRPGATAKAEELADFLAPPGGSVAGAGELDVRGRDPEDRGGEVRQEGAPCSTGRRGAPGGANRRLTDGRWGWPARGQSSWSRSAHSSRVSRW
jgi:fatty-acyl-CoA synthase